MAQHVFVVVFANSDVGIVVVGVAVAGVWFVTVSRRLQLPCVQNVWVRLVWGGLDQIKVA